MKTAGSGLISRSFGAKKSSVAWMTAAPSRGWARSTHNRAKSGILSVSAVIACLSGGVGICGAPMARDVDPPADPEPRVLQRIVEEAGQRRGAPGPADEPAVQAHRHHARRARALGIEHVEAVLQIGVELV